MQQDPRTAEILRLYAEGRSIRHIAAAVRMGNVQIARVLKEAGVIRTAKEASALANAGRKITADAPQNYELPTLLDEDLPFEELIKKHYIPRTEKKIAHKNQFKWMPVSVKVDGPFLYVAQGDQHMDDPYCNLKLFMRHIELMRRPDVLVLPMGDLHNNWVGRLQKLYAHQDMSRDVAYKGIDWYFNHSGLNIPLALAGNHDVWEMGYKILSLIVDKDKTVLADWRAQFELVCPNGRVVKIDAAHDHKGSSQYNALHGQKKAALAGVKADVFFGAHRHTPGIAKDWYPEEGKVCWYVRPGSYKWFDQHAVNNGFPNYQDAPAMCAVVDPETENVNPIVFVSDDMEFALDMLSFLRKKRGFDVRKRV